MSKKYFLVLTIFLISNSQASILSQFLSGGSSVTFVGFTTPSDGSVSGGFAFKAFNSQCNSFSAGSRACLFSDIVKLADNYTYASDAWVVDGHLYCEKHIEDGGGGADFIRTPDGSHEVTATSAKNYYQDSNLNCNGWVSAGSSHVGVYLKTDGRYYFGTCNTARAIPCCK